MDIQLSETDKQELQSHIDRLFESIEGIAVILNYIPKVLIADPIIESYMNKKALNVLKQRHFNRQRLIESKAKSITDQVHD